MTTDETYDLIKGKISEDKVLKQYNETRMKLLSEGYRPSFKINSLFEDKQLSYKEQEDLKALRKQQRKVLDRISAAIAIFTTIVIVTNIILNIV